MKERKDVFIYQAFSRQRICTHVCKYDSTVIPHKAVYPSLHCADVSPQFLIVVAVSQQRSLVHSLAILWFNHPMNNAEAILHTYPWLAAPTDGSPLIAEGDVLRATGDDTVYAVQESIPRLLTSAARVAADKADAVRAAQTETRRDTPDMAVLRTLPYAMRPDEGPGPWLRKKESWEILERALDTANFFAAPPRVVDMGAGIGWLARRLSLRGAFVVALDCSMNDRVGLGLALRLAGDVQAPFLPVQADFAHPPVLPEVADLIVFCDSLPVDPTATLARSAVLLRLGGLLAITDTSIAESAEDGSAVLSQATVDAALVAAGLTVHEWYVPSQTIARAFMRFAPRREGHNPITPRPFILARKGG